MENISKNTAADRLADIGKIFFWIGVAAELIIVMVDKSAYINPWEGQLFRLTFLLFSLKIIMTKYSAKEWLCIAAAGIIAACSYLINGRDEIVRAVVFIIACKDIDIRDVMKAAFGITLCGTIVLFVLSAAGVFGAFKVTANFGRGPFPGIIETRYCFGMGHPNAFQCMLLMMTSLWLYIRADKLKLSDFVLLMLINYAAYCYTDSRTGFLVTALVLLGTALLKYCPLLRNAGFIYIAGAVTVIGFVVFSALGSHTGVENPFMDMIDAFLNGRFKTAHSFEAARVENWKLFGDAANTEYFDAGYVRLFYWYGVIPGAAYIMMNLYLIYQSYKDRDYILFVMVIGFSLFTIMEAHLISVYLLRNYLFILMGYYWYQPFHKGKYNHEGYFWQVKEIINAKN